MVTQVFLCCCLFYTVAVDKEKFGPVTAIAFIAVLCTYNELGLANQY